MITLRFFHSLEEETTDDDGLQLMSLDLNADGHILCLLAGLWTVLTALAGQRKT